MKRSRTRRIAAALLAVAAAAGCASSGGPEAVQPAASPAPASGASASGIARAKADSARYPYTDADVHFMSVMIGHHSQAIVMAELAPTRAGRSSVRTLAARIISSQEDEIATMQQWLRDRRKPVPEATAKGMTMMHDGAAHEMRMPGMLTDAQLKELEKARGSEFDRLFLTYMIQHHRGAVSMVKDLFGSPGAGQDDTVFKFASDVNVDQITEIERMEKMLAALRFEGLSP